MLVSWTPLSYSEAKGLPLYIITYKPPDGSSVGLDNTTSSSIVITGLNPLVGYIFTVQVTTGNGNNKGDPLSGMNIHKYVLTKHIPVWYITFINDHTQTCTLLTHAHMYTHRRTMYTYTNTHTLITCNL